jgi:hypothetical protein
MMGPKSIPTACLLGSLAICLVQAQAACTTSFKDENGNDDAAVEDGATVDAIPFDGSPDDGDSPPTDGAPSDGSPADGSPADAEVVCGNGLIEAGEECDATNLDGETCLTMGYALGELSCSSCTFDFTDCNNNCGGTNQPPCPASYPEDDFDDGVRAGLWASSYAFGESSYDETGGNLVLTLPPTGTGYAGYYTNTLFDLRGDSITIEIVEVPNQCCDGAETQLMVVDSATDDYAGVGLSVGQLLGFYNIAGTSYPFSPTSYDPVQHRYWRLEESAGTFYVDTSADGVIWQPLGSVPNPIAMDSLYIDINAGCWDPVTDPGVARYDNFNILP